VVTANKALLSTGGRELFRAAAGAGVDLLYEASVGGGIPLIRPLRESLAGDRILRFMGIVNGTTNYVLSRMSEEGLSMGQALLEAQRLGYAERDPQADLVGSDAAAKAAILATIAFVLHHLPVDPEGGVASRHRILPMEELHTQYYILMRVSDRPGVLAAIASAFADQRVSIKSVWQEGDGDEAQVVLITHRAQEAGLQACVEELREIEPVKSVSSVIRVEAAEP
jgi:predicted amino acid-binding ACT domain protein